MTPELAVLISVVIGAACGLIAESYLGAIVAGSILGMMVRFGFVVGGVIPNMSNGPVFEGQWFAELFGGCIVVAALSCLVYAVSKRFLKKAA